MILKLETQTDKRICPYSGDKVPRGNLKLKRQLCISVEEARTKYHSQVHLCVCVCVWVGGRGAGRKL